MDSSSLSKGTNAIIIYLPEAPQVSLAKGGFG
jgi:hypothetical protein